MALGGCKGGRSLPDCGWQHRLSTAAWSAQLYHAVCLLHGGQPPGFNPRGHSLIPHTFMVLQIDLSHWQESPSTSHLTLKMLKGTRRPDRLACVLFFKGFDTASAGSSDGPEPELLRRRGGPLRAHPQDTNPPVLHAVRLCFDKGRSHCSFSILQHPMPCTRLGCCLACSNQYRSDRTFPTRQIPMPCTRWGCYSGLLKGPLGLI